MAEPFRKLTSTAFLWTDWKIATQTNAGQKPAGHNFAGLSLISPNLNGPVACFFLILNGERKIGRRQTLLLFPEFTDLRFE